MFEPFVDEELGKMLVLDPSLDHLIRFRELQKELGFKVERSPGKIVWSRFVWRCYEPRVWEGFEVDLLDIGPFARVLLADGPVTTIPGDTLFVTYTWNWWYRSGGGSDPPSRGRGIRPESLVPPLWRVPDLCFSLSC